MTGSFFRPVGLKVHGVTSEIPIATRQSFGGRRLHCLITHTAAPRPHPTPAQSSNRTLNHGHIIPTQSSRGERIRLG